MFIPARSSTVQHCGCQRAAWTVALAVSAALWAPSIAVFFDRYSVEIASPLTAASRADWQAFASIRRPELAGDMVIGQLLLMAILLMGGARALAGNPEAA